MNRSEIKKLLDFGYNEDRVFGFVNAGFNEERFNKNLEILQGIGDKMLEVRDALSDEEIKKLLNHLHKLWREGKAPETVDLTLLEARSLGYGLTEKIDIDFLYFLLKVEEKEGNWTPSCLKGFLHSLLHHWYEFSSGVHTAIRQLIVSHSQKDAKGFAVIASFIDDDGPAKLGAYLLKNNQSWQWAPPIVLMPTTRINYPYFSDTILTYFNDHPQGKYDELLSALNLHNQLRTDKILLPQLILEAEDFDKQLLDVSMKRIGDPFDESQWAPFDGANEEQKKNLRNARKVLLGWIMQEIIRLFFEVLCQDKDRKEFWSKHAHKLSNFKVYGSVFSRSQVLKYLPQQTVNRHFRTVDSNVDNCALAMYMGDYVIIEFTEVGALYAYIVGSKKYQEAFKHVGSLGKIDDLKLSGMPKLYDDDYYKAFAKEGKMNHQGFWQQRMNYWLNRQVKLTDE